jgi:lysophospholipase L1-like esterase
MKKKIQNVLLVVISIILVLYFLEILLTIAKINSTKDIEKKELTKITEKLGGKFRNKYDEYFYQKKNNQKLLIAVNAAYRDLNFFSNYLPLGSISNTELLHCNENGYYSKYQSDKFGFNNNYNWNDEINIFEYVLLGDSYVHGACVNYKDTITGNLQKLASGKVVNLGMSGTGPLLQFATLKEFSKIIKTKKYIWFFYDGNDFENLNEELKNSILLQYLNNENFTQNILNNQNKSDMILKSILNDEIAIRINNTKIKKNNFQKLITLHNLIRLKNSFVRQIKKEKINKEFLLAKYEEILKKSLKIIKQQDAELILVYIPKASVFVKNNTKNSYQEINNIAAKNNIPLLNLEKMIKDNYRQPLELFPNLSRSEVHFNELGYKFIAEIVNNYSK